MSAKNLNHASISISQPAIARDRKYFTIREDRIVPNAECFVKISGNRFNVLDFSSYGFSLSAANDFPDNTGVSCDFYFDDVVFENLPCRKAHSSKMEGGTFKVGFELVANKIDVETIRACQLAYELRPKILDIIAGDTTVPKQFRYLTLDFKDKLAFIQKEVNGISEKLFARDNREYVSQAERAFCSTMGFFFRDLFQGYVKELEATLQNASREVIESSKDYFRKEMSDFIFLAPFISRAYQKPFGYAGDYELMNHIYNNESIGADLFGKVLHKAMLEQPASVAVRNRAEYLYSWILKFLEGRKGQHVKVLSVASGPAKELQFLLQRNPEMFKNITFELLDQDIGALKQAKTDILNICRSKGLDNPITFTNKAIRDIIKSGLNGPYDLIYSAGLFDYFEDAVAHSAAKILHNALAEGGSLIIGNFCTSNPTKFMMELLGDWYLIHRNAQELLQLYRPISEKIKVESEPQGVNLFTVISR